MRTAGSREIATSTDWSGYDFAFPAGTPAAEEIRRVAGGSAPPKLVLANPATVVDLEGVRDY